MNKKIVILLLALFISIGFVSTTIKYAYQEAYQEQYDAAARTLRIERSKVESELATVNQQLKQITIGKGCAVFVFEELQEALYKDVLPIMKDYGFTGVLAISPESYPGKEGCITEDEFSYLLSHGWTVCACYHDYGNFPHYVESMQEIMESLDMDMPKELYVYYGDYQPFKDEEIKEAGFTTVIYHNETEQLIARADEEDLFHMGAIAWNLPSAKQTVEQAVSYGGSLVIYMDFSSVYGKFQKKYFKMMCDFLDSQEEFYMTDLKGARKNVSMAENNDYYSERKKYLEAELERYDQEIEKIYELDLH